MLLFKRLFFFIINCINCRGARSEQDFLGVKYKKGWEFLVYAKSVCLKSKAAKTNYQFLQDCLITDFEF